MNATHFGTLYGYNDWANHRILRAAEGLTDLQFTTASTCGRRSLRGTLAHILRSEWIWYQRCNGISPAAMPVETDFVSLAALRLD